MRADKLDLINQGIAKMKSGAFKDAIRDFNDAIKLHPDYAEAHEYRGVAKVRLGNFDDGIADLSKAIQLTPSARAYYNRGVANEEAGKYDAAITDFNEAIALDENYANAYNHRGAARAALGLFDDAVDDYNKAIELNADLALAYMNLADVKLNNIYTIGNLAGAMQDLSTALRCLEKQMANSYQRLYKEIEQLKT